MSVFSRLAASQDLSKTMADHLGVDLADAFDGTSDVGALMLRGIALRCASCSDQPACAKLLAQNETLDAPPDYCRNAALLERLQRR